MPLAVSPCLSVGAWKGGGQCGNGWGKRSGRLYAAGYVYVSLGWTVRASPWGSTLFDAAARSRTSTGLPFPESFETLGEESGVRMVDTPPREVQRPTVQTLDGLERWPVAIVE